MFDRREVHGATTKNQTQELILESSSESESIKSLKGVGEHKGKKNSKGRKDKKKTHSDNLLNNSSNIISHCILCNEKWASYQGKRRCFHCKMLVLVCNLCQSKGNDRKVSTPPGLLCEICVVNQDEGVNQQSNCDEVGEDVDVGISPSKSGPTQSSVHNNDLIKEDKQRPDKVQRRK